MSDLINPHDRFFKDLLSRPDAATDFLTNYLPPEIAASLDLSAPEMVKDSFIDEELRQHFSDLLYRVSLKRGGDALVYILFEHKSNPDEWVALQLLRYEVRIWEIERRNGAEKLPLIFPLVFYHGREKWNVARQFSALFAKEDLDEFRKYLPEFEHYLCDFSIHGGLELKGGALLQVGLSILRHIYSKDLRKRLAGIFILLSLHAGEQIAIEYLMTILFYISAAAAYPPTETELQESLSTAFPEKEGELMKSFAETWIEEGREEGRKEGRKEGLEEGLEEGRRQGVAATVLRQIHHRFGILDAETTDRIRVLPLERLEQLGDALLDFTSRDDLTAWLLEHSSNET
jgi:predicted transposase/invertase (TIGR01784 family)